MKAIIYALLIGICTSVTFIAKDIMQMPTEWSVVREPFDSQNTWDTYSETLGREIRLK